MRLRTTAYQMTLQLKRYLPRFHKAHHANLATMVVGMALGRSVCLPRIAENAVVGRAVQLESRVQRFERVLQSALFVPMLVLGPVAIRLLRWMHRHGDDLVIVMDRSMINDTLNLLHVAVAFHGRALPLGWIRVPHDGASDLDLQESILRWVHFLVPDGARVTIIADREFHSIHLARFIAEDLGWSFILRIKRKTQVEYTAGCWFDAARLAVRGRRIQYRDVRVTRHATALRVNVVTAWEATESEPWLLITNLDSATDTVETYAKRFWIEEMFSDHKKRAFDLEATRINEPDRLERLLVAVALAYLWTMQVGAFVVATDQWRVVDNRGAKPTVSLCQHGLRWIKHQLIHGFLPPAFTLNFPLLDNG